MGWPQQAKEGNKLVIFHVDVILQVSSSAGQIPYDLLQFSLICVIDVFFPRDYLPLQSFVVVCRY